MSLKLNYVCDLLPECKRTLMAIVASVFMAGSGSADVLPDPVTNVPVSGTLPVCYVNTAGSAPILDKENYLDASLWIDSMGVEGVECFGSEANPVKLQIKGRGNSSWNDFGKKPYKLKLDKKGEPFGFPKSKHFALLSHASTQLYLQGEAAFEMARLIDLGWVPRSFPVEVVLNGVNVGVYAFSETVRIDNGRLEIAEQPEENHDPATISAGWLVEIDNTYDTPQIEVPQLQISDGSRQVARFTIKTPEVISDEQRSWISDQLETMTDYVLNSDLNNPRWTSMIDIESLAKYYIIQEVSGNFDAFVGSTYLHKGEGDKWMFGPIWDSEWTWVNDERYSHIWKERIDLTESNLDYIIYVWIRSLVNYPVFQEKVAEEWSNFYPAFLADIDSFLDKFYNLTKDGYAANGQVWPQYDCLTIEYTYDRLKDIIPHHAAWFDSMVRDRRFDAITEIGYDNASDAEMWYDLQGRRLSGKPSVRGLYIRCRGDEVDKVII